MKKKLMILLSMVMIMACIGLTACGGSDSGEESAETTEATEATEATDEAVDALPDYNVYGYTGEDAAEGAVYEYMATVISKDYELEEGMASIPTVIIIDKVENEDGSVDVYGDFWIDNYTIEGDTLKDQSGGNYPGKMHLVKDGSGYKVENFEQVQDGSNFDPSAKEIFGDKYDAFIKVNADEKTREEIRTETVRNYVKAMNLDVTKYQDYGWDPVEL